MTNQTCRGLPLPLLECPLASLGRSDNTPTSVLELKHKTYHHPLSSSPLNPQIYHHMSRQLPNDDDDDEDTDGIFCSSAPSSGQYQDINCKIHNSNAQLKNDSADMEIYTLLRRSSDSIETRSATPTLFLTSLVPNPKNEKHFLSKKKHNNHQLLDNERFQLRKNIPIKPLKQNITTKCVNNAISLSGHKNQPTCYMNNDSDLINNTSMNLVNCIIDGNSHNKNFHSTVNNSRNNRTIVNKTQDQGKIQFNRLINKNTNNDKNSINHNENNDSSEQYYLEEKMCNTSLDDTVRGLPVGSDVSHFKTEQYILHENSLTKFCDNNRNKCDRMENIIDKGIINTEHFLNIHSGNVQEFVSSQHQELLYNRNYKQSILHNHCTNGSTKPSTPTPLVTSFFNVKENLSSDLNNIDRMSPNLDQGYATLVSPSPTTSTHQTTTPWPKTFKTRPHNNNIGFDRLSDDIIIKIFSWFDNCELCKIAQVCRRFENLAWRPPLWKFIIIKGECTSGDDALKTIFRRLCGQSKNGSCPDVQRVMVSEGCQISNKGLQLLTRRCPELTHLQLQSCPITNQALIDTITKCTNLQHLDITGCTSIASIGLNSGLESSKRLLLQYLDLTDCIAVDDVGLKVIVRNCPQIIFLYLRRCSKITDAGLKFVPSFCLALRELSISDCINITDFGLYELAKLGAVLRYLSVAKCDRISDAGLKVIARRCYKLRYLNCRGLEAVSDDSIIFLARSCPRLRALDIGKCDVSDAGLRAIAESCPNIKKLSLRNCDMITDRGIQCIAYYCRGLQQLNIQDCQISIEGYRAVKRYCKRCIIEHTNPGFY